MFAAAPGIRVLEIYYENESLAYGQGKGCEKESYCLSNFIFEITDLTVLAFFAALLTDWFNSSSYLMRIKSIPSAIKALIAIPVSLLISFSNSYLIESTRILVLTSSAELGMLWSSLYIAFLLSTSVTIFTSKYLTLILFFYFVTYIIYYFIYNRYSKVVNYILKKVYTKLINLEVK